MPHECVGCDGDCACKQLEPGQPCPSCKRRVPYPKTAASPKTKVVAFRAPVDEVEAFKENLEVAAQHVGAAGRPHDAFWTMTAAIAALLQAEDWKGALARGEKA